MMPSSVARPTGQFYRPELDGLRSLAFFAVFFAHSMPQDAGPWAKHAGPLLGAWLAGAVRGGLFGVDLFFALSAYLITEILLRELTARGTIDVKAFWIRRILRIWPLYYLVLITTVVVWPRVMPHESLPPSFAAGLFLFVGNWMLVFQGIPNSSINHLWSVSIEEQFYLTWPLLVRWVPRARLFQMTLSLIPLAVVSRFILIDHLGVMAIFSTPARVDPIALGSLLAFVLAGRAPNLSHGAARALFAAGIAIIIVIGKQNGMSVPIVAAVGYLVLSIACVMLVVSVLSLGSASVLASPAFVYVGRVSYGAYVFHNFCIHFFAQRLGPAVAPVVSLVSTLVLASMSYRWFEQPFLTLKKRFSRHEVSLAATPE